MAEAPENGLTLGNLAGPVLELDRVGLEPREGEEAHFRDLLGRDVATERRIDAETLGVRVDLLRAHDAPVEDRPVDELDADVAPVRVARELQRVTRPLDIDRL